MRFREIAVPYKSVGAPSTFVTHSYLTGTHGRYVMLETKDDATLLVSKTASQKANPVKANHIGVDSPEVLHN